MSDPVLDAFDAVTAPRPPPRGMPASAVLSRADQENNDAYERNPAVAAELKAATARASPAQRAILTDPRQNGTALVSKPAADPVLAAFDSPPTAQSIAAQTPPKPPVTTGNKAFDEVAGLGETAWHVGTGMLSSAAGGLAGLAGTALPGPPGQGAKWSQAIQEAGTYQPRTEAGKRDTELVGSNYNPLNWAPNAGEYVGGQLAEHGMPLAGTAVTTAGAAVPMLLGVKGMRMRSGAAADAASAGRVEPSLQTSPQPGTVAAPTLADASPALQKQVSSYPGADPAMVARHVEADTLPVRGQLTPGQAMQDPALVSEEMNSRGKGKAAPVAPEFYQEQGRVVAKNMDAIRASAAPDVSPTASLVDHGQTLIDAYKHMDEPIKADISAKYKALSDANGGSLPVNGQDFVASADAALAKQMKGRYVPDAVKGDMEQFRSGGPMTFEDFENMRTNLAAEGRKAERNGDGNAAGAINIVRTSLEQLPITGETATIKPLADAARSAAKARFDAIAADPAYKAAITDSAPAGEPSALADKFFAGYVTKGARANVQTMARNLANDPIAKQTIAAGTIDQLKAQMKADPVAGTFTQNTYNSGLNALKPKLDSLVDGQTAQQLQAVGNFAKNAQIQPRGSFVNNSSTLVGALSAGTVGLARSALAVKTMGASEGVIRGVQAFIAPRAAAKATAAATEPGAGLSLSRLMSK